MHLLFCVGIEVEGSRRVVTEVNCSDASYIWEDGVISQQVCNEFLDHWKALSFYTAADVQHQNQIDESCAIWKR